uniref:Uncharacterized protein n=1 Tax=Meloidogyne enterolobii TaxID=390850 RepID=A0A6V7TXS4_MELEN|nr:unnamed protein product [Meloidogyne enterolobii]
MVVGGSSLIGADSADSDLDIIFIIPIICLLNKEIDECKLCKNGINKNQQLCTDHDLLYGEGINNESFTSHIWGVINDIKKEKVSSAYRINIIRGRVSSINVVYAGQNMDILFVVVPYEKIPDLIDLNNHEDKEIIKNNLNLMDSLINDMIKINGIFYNQSILLLTGYRFIYRTNFYLIQPSRRQIFKYLLLAVKLWAKSDYYFIMRVTVSNRVTVLFGSYLVN